MMCADHQPVTIPPVGDVAIPRCAMVLAAGRGNRLRPITETLPKPLVRVRGRALIDHALDRLEEVGVETCVVNVHHLADQVRAHTARRRRPRVVISDETDALLETGGGVRKALPLLGDDPFFVINTDVLWLNGVRPALTRLAEAWDDARMDALLLVLRLVGANGYEGRGDFFVDALGRPRRRRAQEIAPFVYAGVQMLAPRLFEDTEAGSFSLNRLYTQALDETRLWALPHDGEWYHVGTRAGLDLAEHRLGQHGPYSDQ
ncbi:nucleotidyltransferase family protein [Roseospira visakhapatnamensis]|uniref:MurNAc alpha-1-phosphate uridylyltransferase n=1 Tax=Roseospira visakhapatnamensis TaxID=390880 RepID=A0A7W6RA37_9PROT|nr:nucleotidyltransferase family protein [Roseospira visakhapatnamensis]MBB4264714.1 MurNAc alpha-1-phosphate uridylyltransferase [Roseospira visakhapatnamensis]